MNGTNLPYLWQTIVYTLYGICVGNVFSVETFRVCSEIFETYFFFEKILLLLYLAKSLKMDQTNNAHHYTYLPLRN